MVKMWMKSSYVPTGPGTAKFYRVMFQDDRPLWVGLTTDPTDERDFKNGKFNQLTASGSVAIEPR
jgi:hypothetical protein